MSTHLSQFNSIFSQLVVLTFVIDDEFKASSISLCHGQLGHMSQTGMKVLSFLGYKPRLRYANFEHCDNCVYGKPAQTSHKRSLLLGLKALQVSLTKVENKFILFNVF